jgi:hypothetical protein
VYVLQTVGNHEWDKGLPALKHHLRCPQTYQTSCVLFNLHVLQTVGNHEWDKGLPALKQYLDKQDNKAVLAANIDYQGHELQHKIKPYVVKQVKGKKVSAVLCCATGCAVCFCCRLLLQCGFCSSVR